jgi:hypothetical protein
MIGKLGLFALLELLELQLTRTKVIDNNNRFTIIFFNFITPPKNVVSFQLRREIERVFNELKSDKVEQPR